MKWLDLTLPSPVQNLACDEALLEICEETGAGEVLRFWESREKFVVVGYTGQIRREVNVENCCKFGVPILRRTSGGGTVLQGAGCLNYALILKIQNGATENVGATNIFVMERQRAAMQQLLQAPVEVQGFTDLTIGGRKFSGNAQKRKQKYLLFHGTFLLDFDISLLSQLLQFPPKQPEYRATRTHEDFVVNLNIEAEKVQQVLREVWGAHEVLNDVPTARIETLAREKFASDEWNWKF